MSQQTTAEQEEFCGYCKSRREHRITVPVVSRASGGGLLALFPERPRGIANGWGRGVRKREIVFLSTLFFLRSLARALFVSSSPFTWRWGRTRGAHEKNSAASAPHCNGTWKHVVFVSRSTCSDSHAVHRFSLSARACAVTR